MADLDNELQGKLKKMIVSGTQAAHSLASKLREINLRRQLLEEKKKEMANGTDLCDIVKLNIGGKHIDIRRSTASQLRSRLAWMLGGRWDHAIPRDRDGRMFLDIDPEWVEPIINHLRELILADPHKSIKPPSVLPEFKQGFNRAVVFFGLESAFHPAGKKHVEIQSIIIQESYMKEALMCFAGQALSQEGDVKFELLYRGTRDTFSSAAFHQRCDNRPNTFTIVQDTDGSIFGGFADAEWSSRGAYTESIRAFLFSLSVKGANDADSVIKCPLDGDGRYALNPSSLPAFGRNPDLKLADNCNTNKLSTLRLGGSYRSIGGPASFTGGSSNFQVKELEVFQATIHKSPSNHGPSIVTEPPSKRRRADFETCEVGLPVSESALLCHDVISQLQGLHEYESYLWDRSIQLQSQMNEVENDELDFENEISFMRKLLDTKDKVVLHFNVGGTKFYVEKKTLLQIPESVLCTQYCSSWWMPNEKDLDDSGWIFLDMNPYCFGKIVSKLRFMAMTSLVASDRDGAASSWDGLNHFHVHIDAIHRDSFERMINYFQIDPKLFRTVDSVILDMLLYLDALENWVDSSITEWVLLYRGSRDGFGAEAFHRCCDEQPFTLTIVRDTRGSLFGGFADTMWTSSGGCTQAIGAFIFSLSVRGVTEPRRFHPKDSSRAVLHHQSHLATFGSSTDPVACDLHICPYSNINDGSRTKLGYAYHADGPPHFLTGGVEYFKVSEIEVFRVRR